MTPLLSLGDLFVSDFLREGEDPRGGRYPLSLVMTEEGVVQLTEQPPPQEMWGEYWYRSGINDTMRAELRSIVRSIERRIPRGENPLWVDIASNDGTLLSFVNPAWRRIGVDPADESFAEEARQHGTILVEPFTSTTAAGIVADHGRAQVVTCIAMFYDLFEPQDFLAGVYGLLEQDGVFVLQMSYTPLMLRQVAFDNICHEHARYYTLESLEKVLLAAGFRVRDVEVNDVNGGSFRVYCQREDAAPKSLGSQPWRDTAEVRTESLRVWEAATGANNLLQWRVFAERLLDLRDNVVDFVKQVTSEGKTVWGYGASTKGNTLLQFFGLDSTLITAIAERQPQKWGLRTVGTDIPIVPENTMRIERPDYLLVLPWHFISEFRQRERQYLVEGGRMIVPCPRFEVVGP